jgi:hypothetical protein
MILLTEALCSISTLHGMVCRSLFRILGITESYDDYIIGIVDLKGNEESDPGQAGLSSLCQGYYQSHPRRAIRVLPALKAVSGIFLTPLIEDQV